MKLHSDHIRGYRIDMKDGTTLWNFCDPVLPWYLHKKLHDINPDMYFKWNRIQQHWEVWHDRRPFREPYCMMRVANDDDSYRPVDDRVFRQIRYNIWFSKNLLQNMETMLYNHRDYRVPKLEEQEKDRFGQMAKEIAPLGVSLLDAGSASHGKSKFMWQGYGDSRVNA